MEKGKTKAVDVQVLREFFSLDPESGLLTWKKPARKQTKVGSVAGCRSTGKKGCVRVGLHGGSYLAHRVVWALHYGEWPSRDIDHINGDATDNRVSNLRLATKTQNMMNAKKRKDSSSGVKGVYWHKASKSWAAQIVEHRSHHYLGLYETKEDAAIAVKKARNELHGEFARHG